MEGYNYNNDAEGYRLVNADDMSELLRNSCFDLLKLGPKFNNSPFYDVTVKEKELCLECPLGFGRVSNMKQ